MLKKNENKKIRIDKRIEGRIKSRERRETVGRIKLSGSKKLSDSYRTQA